MRELWGEYASSKSSESILTQSDFMLSSYRQVTSATPSSESDIIWSVVDEDSKPK